MFARLLVPQVTHSVVSLRSRSESAFYAIDWFMPHVPEAGSHASWFVFVYRNVFFLAYLFNRMVAFTLRVTFRFYLLQRWRLNQFTSDKAVP